jgi:hypothetical protein
MDCDLERQHLAEEHIWKAKRTIDRQLDLIENLERQGCDIGSAEFQLQTFEDVFRAMLQHKKAIERRIIGMEVPV